MEYPDITDKYQIVKRIGAGGFKTAYIATRSDDKCTNPENFVLFKFHKKKNIRHEIENMKRFKEYFEKQGKCSNLVLCPIDVGLYENKFTIVTNFFRGQSLWDYLNNKETKITFKNAVKIMSAILEALKQLHDIKFIHFDIKPENIMIHEEEETIQIQKDEFTCVKKESTFFVGIIDIDNGCFLDDIEECLKHPVSTQGYFDDVIYQKSLESINKPKQQDYIYNIDIYGLGKTFIDIISKTDYKDSPKIKNLVKILEKMVPYKLKSPKDIKNYYTKISQIIKDFKKVL